MGRPIFARPANVRSARRRARRGFSLVELTVVILIIGVLAAIVIPQFAGAAEDARTGATESTLAGVRSSIAAFRARQVIEGGDPYPTLPELLSGDVVRAEVPDNPFSGIDDIQLVTRAQAEGRVVVADAAFGWNYFVDNASDPPVAIFYANSSLETTREDELGNLLLASEL